MAIYKISPPCLCTAWSIWTWINTWILTTIWIPSIGPTAFSEGWGTSRRCPGMTFSLEFLNFPVSCPTVIHGFWQSWLSIDNCEIGKPIISTPFYTIRWTFWFSSFACHIRLGVINRQIFAKGISWLKRIYNRAKIITCCVPKVVPWRWVIHISWKYWATIVALA